jgi:hypothetical protein
VNVARYQLVGPFPPAAASDPPPDSESYRDRETLPVAEYRSFSDPEAQALLACGLRSDSDHYASHGAMDRFRDRLPPPPSAAASCNRVARWPGLPGRPGRVQVVRRRTASVRRAGGGPPASRGTVPLIRFKSLPVAAWDSSAINHHRASSEGCLMVYTTPKVVYTTLGIYHGIIKRGRWYISWYIP